jgi:hypothetical protein
MARFQKSRLPHLKLLPIKLLQHHLYQCRSILAAERDLRALRCEAWDFTYDLLEQGQRAGLRGNDGQNWITSGSGPECCEMIHYIINLKVAISEA